MNNVNKKYLPYIVVALVVILGFSSVMIFSRKDKPTEEQTQSSLPTSAVVPTIDSSVKVSLDPVDAGKHEVELSIKNIPNGTTSIEYELSYDTRDQGSQGIIPDEPISVAGKKEYSKKFLLGTESSGAKTYHVLTSPIKLVLTFNGSYGKKSFEKEFDL